MKTTEKEQKINKKIYSIRREINTIDFSKIPLEKIFQIFKQEYKKNSTLNKEITFAAFVYKILSKQNIQKKTFSFPIFENKENKSFLEHPIKKDFFLFLAEKKPEVFHFKKPENDIEYNTFFNFLLKEKDEELAKLLIEDKQINPFVYDDFDNLDHLIFFKKNILELVVETKNDTWFKLLINSAHFKHCLPLISKSLVYSFEQNEDYFKKLWEKCIEEHPKEFNYFLQQQTYNSDGHKKTLFSQLFSNQEQEKYIKSHLFSYCLSEKNKSKISWNELYLYNFNTDNIEIKKTKNRDNIEKNINVLIDFFENQLSKIHYLFIFQNVFKNFQTSNLFYLQEKGWLKKIFNPNEQDERIKNFNHFLYPYFFSCNFISEGNSINPIKKIQEKERTMIMILNEIETAGHNLNEIKNKKNENLYFIFGFNMNIMVFLHEKGVEITKNIDGQYPIHPEFKNFLKIIKEKKELKKITNASKGETLVNNNSKKNRF